MSLPTKFADLEVTELYRSALADFAVDVKEEEKGDKKALISALTESGVKWKDYVAMHPEVAPPKEEKTVAPVANPNVVTAEQVRPSRREDIRTASPNRVEQDAQYLVKMNRENPYFEFGTYRFTKDNPFAVMDAESTSAILREEVGFAIASPDEAQEYYGL